MALADAVQEFVVFLEIYPLTYSNARTIILAKSRRHKLPTSEMGGEDYYALPFFVCLIEPFAIPEPDEFIHPRLIEFRQVHQLDGVFAQIPEIDGIKNLINK